MLSVLSVFTLMLLVSGEHHLRHSGLLTAALRERLGLTENNNGMNNMNSMPDLSSVISNVGEGVQSAQERILQRFSILSGLGKDLLNPQPAQGDMMEETPLRRLIRLVFNNMMKGLQTVEGGQEAQRWMDTLKSNFSGFGLGTSAPSPSNQQEAPEEVRNITLSLAPITSTNEIDDTVTTP